MAPRSVTNFLAGPYLNRVTRGRLDEQTLRAAVADPATRFVPLWRHRNLVQRSAAGLTAFMWTGARASIALEPSQLILLGEYQSHWCFAVELRDDDAPPLDSEQQEFQDLRAIAGELPADEAGILAYARALVLWRERNRFCGRCGARALPAQAGHIMRCSDPQCSTPHFPRIDPAIIVLVSDGERALLGRQPSWPPRRYSTIAGFVEPGESLEDAVAREVLEETGVTLDTVDYHSSQPWPFPSSLMLGFTARARTTAIQCCDRELEDARWFSRAQIAAGEIRLPPMHSISFRLIEDWYDAGAERPLRDVS